MKYTEKIIESSVLLLVIIDMILLLILTFSNVSQHVEQKIIYFDLFVCFILWIDFIYNLYKSNNKKQFLKENWLTIIAIIPLDYFFLRWFRFIRIIRLIRFSRVLLFLKGWGHSVVYFIKSTNLDKLIYVVVIFVVISSIAILFIEDSVTNLIDAFWCIIVTLTSVGYGDITPHSIIGKVISYFVILLGIIFFSTLTAAISSIYVSKITDDSEKDLNSKIDELKEENKKLENKIDELKEIIMKNN